MKGVYGNGGILSVEHLQKKINPDDFHYARTRLDCLENTLNRAGLKMHLGGNQSRMDSGQA